MKRRKIGLLIVVTFLLISAVEVIAAMRRLPNYQYYSASTGSMGIVSVEFKNGIDASKTGAGAETWVSYSEAASSVDATFYWLDYDNHTIGSVHKYAPASKGSHEVYGDSLAETGKQYYQVVSTHYAYYGATTLSYTNLTTFVP